MNTTKSNTGQEDNPTPTNALVMTDFAFGGIEQDDVRRLEYEKQRWQAVRHEYAIEPMDPMPDTPVKLTVTVGQGVAADHVVAYVTLDGSAPAGSRGVAHNGFALPFHKVDVRWEALVWSFVEVWEATIPGQPEGTFVRYDIEAWHSAIADTSHWSREQNIDGTIDTITHYGFGIDTFTPPDWAKDSITYQIFIDRFRDHRRSDAEHDYLEPDEMHTFWGGTLRGIIDSLDYIQSLGVTVVWVTPFFKTRSYHGYDTTDYFEVDERFGTKDDLRVLITALHARNMRFVLDLVVNHVSLDFPPFVRASASTDAPDRAWFRFDPIYRHGYRTFFDVASMPQLELDYPEARDYMVEVATYWLREFDVDGYRLDYAAGPSHLFWSWFRKECRRVKPDCWVYGEVTRAGSLLRAYSGRLDGCLDFGFSRSVRRLFAPAGLVTEFATDLRHVHEYFGGEFSLPAFLDNHDINRILWMLGNDKQRLRLALALLFGLAESPILYYGTEVGLGQPRPKENRNEESRQPMLWSPELQDAALLAYTRRWIHARREHRALSRGDLRTLEIDDARRVWLVERVWQEDRVLLAINVGADPATMVLPEGDFVDLEGQTHAGVVEVASMAALLLAPAAQG